MGKLCTNQLIGKLVALLREADPDKFDDAVAQAKQQLDTEAKRAKRTDIEKLFASQIATLKDRGVPEQIVEILQNQKGSVLKKASEMAIGEGNLLFVPVINKSAYLGYYGLMSLVRNRSKEGYIYLNPTQISDVVDAPSEPYYIYDVEDGNATSGKSPQDAEKTFKQQKRSGLTAAEAMALTTHTDVLSRHYVWATGSRAGRAVKVPFVGLDDGDWPRFSCGDVACSDDDWARRPAPAAGTSKYGISMEV